MRDLDRFEKRKPIHHSQSYDTPDYKISWGGTFFRLFFFSLFILFLGWGIREIYRPANVWIMQHEITRAENDVRMLRQDAELARREMAAPKPVTVESIIAGALECGEEPELTEEQKQIIRKNWHQFLSGSKISDPEMLLFRLKMRYDENGEIEDYPNEEWVAKKAELDEKKKEISQEEAMRQLMGRSANDFAENATEAEKKRIEALDKQRKKLYDRRSNGILIKNIVEEVNESFYSGESPYEENASDELPLDEETAEEANEETAEEANEETADEANEKAAEEANEEIDEKADEETDKEVNENAVEDAEGEIEKASETDGKDESEAEAMEQTDTDAENVENVENAESEPQ